MTFREYLEENLEEIVVELCQYQDCENCSVRALFGGGGGGGELPAVGFIPGTDPGFACGPVNYSAIELPRLPVCYPNNPKHNKEKHQ